MKYSAYLVLNGKAREAVDFYKAVFGGEVEIMQTFGEAPQNPEFPLPEEAKDRILHVNLKIGEQQIMFSDTFPGQEVVEGVGTVTITLNDITAEERLH